MSIGISDCARRRNWEEGVEGAAKVVAVGWGGWWWMVLLTHTSSLWLLRLEETMPDQGHHIILRAKDMWLQVIQCVTHSMRCNTYVLPRVSGAFLVGPSAEWESGLLKGRG